MQFTMLGHGWAQPVGSRRWAIWCTALSTLSRASGHRILNHRKHVAWMRACGL